MRAWTVTRQHGDANLEHVFVCGHPALDFAATLRARRTAGFEMFVSPERLDAWHLGSGLVDAVSPSQDTDAERAVAVREALYRLFTARRLGAPYDTGAPALVNSAARQVTRRHRGPWRARPTRLTLCAFLTHIKAPPNFAASVPPPGARSPSSCRTAPAVVRSPPSRPCCSPLP